MVGLTSDEDYEAFEAEMAEVEARARKRQGRSYPMDYGTEMGPGHYFCEACWMSGYGDGRHGYHIPPCDPPGTVRGPYDPR